jgi:hypothetical protein
MKNRQVCFAPTSVQIDAYLEAYRPWVELTLGCPLADSVMVEMDLPFGDLMSLEVLSGVPLIAAGSDDEAFDVPQMRPWGPFTRPRTTLLPGTSEARPAAELRALVTRWQLPPGVSPRIRLEPASGETGPSWEPHWRDTPVALWLRDSVCAVVAMQVPVVDHEYTQGPHESSQCCVLINRREAASALAALREFFELRHKRIVVIGGDEVPLVAGDYDWNGVVLAPTLTQEIQDDFERFLRSRPWFRTQRLSFRRSYLLHGPPGNGKTSVARIMASHPAISAFTLNFSMPELGDRDVSELFAAAARASPALVIIEDLDRLFGREGPIDRRDQEADNRTAITLPHLLNCLDGLYSGEGVVVVATANRVRDLEPALRRRFNVIAACSLPTAELRAEYFRRRTPLTADAIALAVGQSEAFTFAELAAAYTTAGTLAYERGGDISVEDLTDALARVRRAAHAEVRARAGFGPTRNGDN